MPTFAKLNSKSEFIKYIIDNNILLFGQFTLKSGRNSPYFFNAGLFNSGYLLNQLTKHYAITIIEQELLDFDVIYGPAYKGITLASATAIALSEILKKDVKFAYDRKEAKTRGEKGVFVGSSINNQKLLLIDDVVSAGNTVKEAITKTSTENAKINNMIIALDRCEKIDVSDHVNASEMIATTYGVNVASIINLFDILTYLKKNQYNHATIASIEEYLNEFGAI